MVIKPTKKQLAAIEKALARFGRKLPAPGKCEVLTRKGGKPLLRRAKNHVAVICQGVFGPDKGSYSVMLEQKYKLKAATHRKPLAGAARRR